jgi:RimJ/RimL family protein N-acetyltransferase
MESTHGEPTSHDMQVTRVVLRQVVEDDLAIFFCHQDDSLSSTMARVARRNRATDLARWRRLLADQSVAVRTVVAGGSVAGYVMSFHRNDVRELGYWLGREFWGRGYAGDAVRQYLRLELQRPLFAIVAEDNVGSRRILARCGFREFEEKDGVLHYRLPPKDLAEQ